MTQQQLLEAILDKTAHIRGGIVSGDIDIVANALDEREALISNYAGGGFSAPAGEAAIVASRIAEMDVENSQGLKKMMDECGEKLFEARRKIKELQTGKKAAGQYQGAASGGNRGAVLDFKK